MWTEKNQKHMHEQIKITVNSGKESYHKKKYNLSVIV